MSFRMVLSLLFVYSGSILKSQTCNGFTQANATGQAPF